MLKIPKLLGQLFRGKSRFVSDEDFVFSTEIDETIKCVSKLPGVPNGLIDFSMKSGNCQADTL